MSVILIVLSAQYRIRHTETDGASDLNDSMQFDTVETSRTDKEAQLTILK